MDAVCWSDYICPWCYVGQARDGLLAELGVTVTHLPYELHPEIGPEGRRVRPDGRLGPTFERIEAACADADLPFNRPARMQNTRRALESAEWVRRQQPSAFPAVHRAFFAAQFELGIPLDDLDALDELLTGAGADAAAARAAVDGGDPSRWVDESMTQARDTGVASTPTWVLDGGLVLPGAFDDATMRRWVTRVVAKSDRGRDEEGRG